VKHPLRDLALIRKLSDVGVQVNQVTNRFTVGHSGLWVAAPQKIRMFDFCFGERGEDDKAADT